MIGLDTNVVIRLLVQDDPAQLRRARKAVQQHCSEDDPGLINSIVLVEVFWVLGSVYDYEREEVVKAIEGLLQIREIEIQYRTEAWEALRRFQEGKVGFADCYLGSINRENGCSSTLTFDKKAAKLDWFELVK
jgi:predicted nucleic-acid-binding protein